MSGLLGEDIMKLGSSGKKYKIILADPPWSYQFGRVGHEYKHGSAAKYETMSVETLCSLNVCDITNKNSVLFLWATTPLLPDAFTLMTAWGFKYKTAIYWRKIMSLGMGFWFRGQVEVCLMGIKGSIKAFHSQKPNFIQSKVRKHSQKPDELYSIIEELNLNPKIELFARQRREGWDVYGNELSDTIQKKIVVTARDGKSNTTV